MQHCTTRTVFLKHGYGVHGSWFIGVSILNSQKVKADNLDLLQ